MKKLKFILLPIILLVLTGCEATYTLTIDQDKMIEKSTFLIDKNDENEDILNKYLESNYQAYYDMDLNKTFNYEKKAVDKNDKIGMKLEYTYTGNNLQHSSLLDRCYYKKSVTKTENQINITTDGKTTCFYKDTTKNLDKLTINIKTDLKVIENNADKINKNTYTWIIDDSNYQNHPINIKIALPDKTQDKGLSQGVIIFLCILGTFLLTALIILIFILIKRHQNNKI